MRNWLALVVLVASSLLAGEDAFAAPVAADPHATAQLAPPVGAPSVYSPQQRAQAVQTVLHLAGLPILGPSVSLTPVSPQVPGVAQLDFDEADFDGGDLNLRYNSGHFSFPATGQVTIHRSDLFVRVGIVAHANQVYVWDCRLSSSVPISYEVQAGVVTFDVTKGVQVIRPDGHLIFAASRTTDGLLVAYLDTGSTGQGLVFYGCDIADMRTPSGPPSGPASP